MKTRNFWIAVVVVFLVCGAYEFLIHGVILTNQYYTSMAQVLIQQGEVVRSLAWLQQSSIFLAEAIFAFFFTLIYTRGVEGKGWAGEGARYGILVWGIAQLPMFLSMYAWARFPGKLLMWWIIYGLLECVILGLVCAAIYKKPAAA